MTGRTIVAWVAATVAIVLPVVVALVDALTGWPSGGFYLAFAPAPVCFAAVGWLITLRRPENVVGPLCITFALVFAIYFPIDLLVRLGAHGAPLELAATLSSASDAPGFIAVAMILVLFPDGRYPTQRWRWTGAVAIAGSAASIIGFSLDAGPLAAFPGVTNPIGIEGFPGAPIGELGYVALVLLLVASIAGLVTRWRRGRPVERAQLKWVSGAAAILFVAEILNLATFDTRDPLGSPIPVLLASTGTVLVPLAIGVAVLRYRLYEIDRLISRTIGWALVTGVLVGAFVGSVLGLQALLGDVTQGETLAVAVSTLVAFALFQTVRQRVQRAVDQRFDRARYDADHIAAAFAARSREQVDLDALAAELQGTATRSVRPTSATVWLHSRVAR